MKYIKYLFLALVAAVMLPSCADEGPEPIGNISASVSYVSITPTTATISLSYSLGSEWQYNHVYVVPVNEYDDDRYYYGEPAGNDFLRFSDLKPNTEYKICVEIEVKNYSDEYVSTTIVPENGTFTTKAEGDYSELGKAVLTTTLSAETAAVIHIELPAGIQYTNDNFGIRFSKSSDFADAQELTIRNRYTEYGYIQEENYSDYIGLTASLTNLEKNTAYYVEVIGDFAVRSEYSQITELPDLHTIACEPAFFTTAEINDPSVLGPFSSTVNYIRPTGAYIEGYLGENVTFASIDDNHLFNVLHYSTDKNFANADTVHITSFYNNNFSVKLSDLQPETTYYYYLEGKFNYRIGDGFVTYEASIYPEEGTGSFTTLRAQNITDQANLTATVRNITSAGAVIDFLVDGYVRFNPSYYNDGQGLTLLISTSRDFSNPIKLKVPSNNAITHNYNYSDDRAIIPVTGLKASTTYYYRLTGDLFLNGEISTGDFIEPLDNSFTTAGAGDAVNGHFAIDLGLPSGTKWANVNVGSESMLATGNYYTWADAPAAATSMGSGWTLPSAELYNELLSSCNNGYITIMGVTGYIFTASNGNFLFFPANGYKYTANGNIRNSDTHYMWTASPDTYSAGYATCFTGSYTTSFTETYCLGVRAVVK